MTVTIRLEADWGLSPYYVDEGDGLFEAHDDEDFAARFDLPDHVVHVLDRWDRAFQAVMNWDDPAGSDWMTTDDRSRWLEQGRAAARLLRGYIPPEVRICYIGDGNTPDEYY